MRGALFLLGILWLSSVGCVEDGELIVRDNLVLQVQAPAGYVALGHAGSVSIGMWLQYSVTWYNAASVPNCGFAGVDIVPLDPSSGPMTIDRVEVLHPGEVHDTDNLDENSGCYVVASARWTPEQEGEHQFVVRQHGAAVGQPFVMHAVLADGLEIGSVEAPVEHHSGYVRGGRYVFGARPLGSDSAFGFVRLGDLTWSTADSSRVTLTQVGEVAHADLTAAGSTTIAVESVGGLSGKRKVLVIRSEEIQSVLLMNPATGDIYGDGEVFEFDPSDRSLALYVLATTSNPAAPLVLPDQQRLSTVIEGGNQFMGNVIPVVLLKSLIGDICVEYFDHQACIQTAMQ